MENDGPVKGHSHTMMNKKLRSPNQIGETNTMDSFQDGGQQNMNSTQNEFIDGSHMNADINNYPPSSLSMDNYGRMNQNVHPSQMHGYNPYNRENFNPSDQHGGMTAGSDYVNQNTNYQGQFPRQGMPVGMKPGMRAGMGPPGGPMMPANYQQRMSGQSISQQSGPTPTLNQLLQTQSTSSTSQRMQPNNYNEFSQQKAMNEMNNPVPYSLSQPWGGNQRAMGYQQSPVGGHGQGYRSQNMSELNQPRAGFPPPNYQMQQQGQYSSGQFSPNSRYSAIPNRPMNMPNAGYGHPNPQMSSGQPPGLTPSPASGIASPMSSDSPLHRQPSPSPLRRQPTPTSQSSPQAPSGGQQHSPSGSTSSWSGTNANGNKKGSEEGDMDQSGSDDLTGENSQGLPTSNSPHPSVSSLRPIPSPVGSSSSRSNTPASLPGNQAGSPMPPRPPSQHDSSQRMTQSPMATSYNQQMMPPPMGPNQMNIGPSGGKMAGAVPGAMNPGFSQYNSHFSPGNYTGRPGMPSSGGMHNYPSHHMYNGPMFNNMSVNRNSNYNSQYNAQNSMVGANNPNMSSNMGSVSAPVGPAMDMTTNGPRPFTPSTGQSNSAKSAQAAAHAALMAAANQRGSQPNSRANVNHPSQKVYGQPGQGNHAGFHGSPGMNSHSPVPNSVLPNYNMPKSSSVAEVADSSSHNSHPSSQDGCNSQSNGPPMNSIDASSPSSNIEKMPSQQNIPPSRKQNMQRDSNISSSSNDSVTSSSELTANSANTNLPPQSSFDSKEPQSGTPPSQGLPAESLGADSNLSSLTDSSSQGGDGPSNICEQKEAEIPNMPDQSNLPPNSKQELPITTTATTHTMDVNIVTQSNTCPVMSTTEVVSDSRDHIPPLQQNCLPINPMPPMEEPVPEKKKKKGAGDVHKLFEMGNEPDRHFFLNRLLAFLEERNSPIHNMPSISKQPLDLFRLYHCVRERGGMMEVTKAKKWKEICGLINIGSSASAAFTLKKNYIKYLFHYECQFDRNGMDPGPILANMEAQLAQKRESKKSRAPSPAGSQSSQEPFRPPSNSNANQGMEGYPNNMGGQGYDPSMGPMGMPGMVPPNHMMNNMMPPNSMGGGMGHNQMQSGSMGHSQMQGGMVHPGMMGGNAFSMRGGMINHNMMPPNNMMGNNMMANNMGMGNNMMSANMGMQHGGNMQHSGNMGSSMRMGHGNGPNNMGMHTGNNMHTGNMSMPPNNNMGMMPGNNVNMSQNNMAMPQNNMSSAIPIPPGNQHMGMPGSRNNMIPANTMAGQCVPPHNSDSISCQDPFADDMNNAYSNSSGQPTSQPSNFSGMPSQNNAGSNFNNNSNFNKDRLPPNSMAANPNSLTANVPSGAMGQTPSSISSPPTSMGPNSSSIGPNVNSMGPSVSSMGPTPTSVGQIQPNSSQMGQDQSTPQSRQTASPSNSTTQNMPPNMSQNIPSNAPQGGLPPSSMSQTFSNTVNQCPPQNNMSQQHMQNFPPSMENSHPNLPPDSSVPFSNYQASSNSQDGENSTGSSSSMGLTAPSSGRQFPFGENQFNKPERFDSPNPVQSITPTPTPPPQRQPTPQSSTPSSVASQPPDSTFSSNRYANQSPMMQQGPHVAGAPDQYNQPANYMPQPGYPTPTKGMMAEQYPNYPSQYNSYPNQRTPMRNDMPMYGTPKQRYPEQYSNQAGYNSQPPSSGYSTQPPGYNSQSPGYNSSGMMGYNSQQSSYGEQGSYTNYQRDSMSTYDSQDTRSNNQWSPMPQRFPQQNPHSMSPAPNMPTHMASGVPYSRNRMSPTPRQQSYMSPPKMLQKGMIPQNHIPKKDIPFPPDSVEATTPNYYKRRRLTRTDVGPIEAWRVMMALKSGMLAESTWALDTLNILLFDDATVQYFNLAHLPGLLEALLEHFRKSLISIFGEIFEDMEKMSDEADENPNKDFADINMEDRISLEPSEFTNYTHVSRKGLEVKFEDSGKEISPSDSKKWDVFSGYTYKYGHWQLGGGDMSSHILPCFGSENESETFRKFYIRPPMELKDEYKNSAESIGLEKSENDERVLEQKEDSKLDLNKIKCEVVEDHLKNNILRKVKIKKEPEDLTSNNNEGVDLKEKCEENENGGCEIKHETENVKTELEMKTETVIKQEDNVTSNENMCSKRKFELELEDESYQKDDPPLRMISDAQDDLGKRCVCISNILRSLSSIPSNHLELSKHPGLMYTLGKLLMLNHRHLPRNTTRTKFDRDDAELDILDSHLMQTDQEWWWNYFIVLRENTLVILANICGHLELKYYPEEICLPVLDGLLHWAVCPSSCATDPLSSSSVLSPQRLVLEALSKLCIHETNVDLLLATPPFDRIVQLFSILTKLLANKSEPVTLEFALVLLSSLVQGDSSSARAIAMQHPSISLLLDFLESAEHKAMQVANHHGISALRENPEIMGTSLDMLRRAATILLHLSLVPENRSQFVHQQPRILALVMSQILDQFVAQILSDVLYQCFQSQDSISS